MVSSNFSVALDVGGTFTDVVLVDMSIGRRWTIKTPSTPHNPAEAFFSGIKKIIRLADIEASDVSRVFHGSTIATNAVLEGKGASIGMLITNGFKYVLEIGRHDIPRKENLYTWVKPARPIRPRHIREVRERVAVDGSIELQIEPQDVHDACEYFKSLDIEAIAVIFLHSYLNPENEKETLRLVKELLPGVLVSISSDVLPVFREYERAMATTLNAYVSPKVSTYISELHSGMSSQGIDAPLLIMKSNGGVFGPEEAARQSIDLALSGPAAGIVGACDIALNSGTLDAITVDIGGTSADISLIRNGLATMTNEGEIGPFPIHLPTVDIHTIGAGGGSIASVSPEGILTVGPASAGASPGPACYGKGGKSPTVTDANLVLGRIPPHLLDGEVPLNVELAEQAIVEAVARPLGLSLIAAAAGILDIVNNNMVGALKVVSVEKGYDPTEFVLIAYGGAGPMHASELSRHLGTRGVLIPHFPGVLCATGLLASDLQYDFVRTCLQRASVYDLEAIKKVLVELSIHANQKLAVENVKPSDRETTCFADIRYAKQGYELTVPFSRQDLDQHVIDELIDEFHARHQQLYTFCDRSADVEIVNIRVKAIGHIDKVKLGPLSQADIEKAISHTKRSVFFPTLGFIDTPVYRREKLLAEQRITGPGIVDQPDSTTVIFPGEQGVVDTYGSIYIEQQ